MEIRDVIFNIREENLRLSRKVDSLTANVEMLERFTWNLLRELRQAVAEGCQIIWDLDAELESAESTMDSTEDSPEGTDDDDPTLF